ncbi:MAG: Ribosomal protein L11 methyltransferase [Planctomycetes bacterium]|nr:Ribosomal protein L11 methyltransferase [Planctomycetota bacterium]
MRHRTVRVAGVEIREAWAPGCRSDHSTRFLIRHAEIRSGERVAEIGCGSGVVAAAAARLGAAVVWASDVDPRALELAAATAAASGADVRVVSGSMLDAVPSGEPIDHVLCVMPQKPSPERFSVRYAGGRDGAELLASAIRAAAGRLRPGGRITLYHHSIAAPAAVEAELSAAFGWRVAAERLRCFSESAYASLAPGMLEHLMVLRTRGAARVERRGAHLVWTSRVLVGVRT